MISPLITSYPTHANIMSTLLQYENSIQWFYENYIQLFARTNAPEFCYVDFYAPLPWKACPWLYSTKISREMLKIKGKSIIKFLIESIDLGNYIFLYLNHFHLSHSNAYKKNNIMHDTYIYGYDLKEEYFTVADFFNMKYQNVTVGFSDVEKAYDTVDLTNIDDLLEGIILLKPLVLNDYKINIKKIVCFIGDYLNSKISGNAKMDGYRQDIETNQDNFVFGIDIYLFLRKYLEKFIDNKNINRSDIDIRGFHVLYDHKILMLYRLEYLVKNNYLDKRFVSIFKKILDNSKILRNLVIKGSVSSKEEIFKRAICLIENIKLVEKTALEEVHKELSCCNY